jgi:DNA-binding NarL/FixJ family response regulator
MRVPKTGWVKNISPHRLRILQMIAYGLTSTEIARALKCPRNSVRENMEAILYNLDAKRLPEAIYKAMKLGILT